jgi:hypothetical protein
MGTSIKHEASTAELKETQNNTTKMEETKNQEFFSTQIPEQHTEDVSQQLNKQSSIKKSNSEKTSPVGKGKDGEDDPLCLHSLLVEFNSHDSKERGIITMEEGKAILTEKGIPTDKCTWLLTLLALITRSRCQWRAGA